MLVVTVCPSSLYNWFSVRIAMYKSAMSGVSPAKRHARHSLGVDLVNVVMLRDSSYKGS